MKVVSIDPEIMWGTPCFFGTRVPIQTLHDFIDYGDTIDEFLRQFPDVTKEQVQAYLEEAQRLMVQNSRKTA